MGAGVILVAGFGAVAVFVTPGVGADSHCKSLKFILVFDSPNGDLFVF